MPSILDDVKDGLSKSKTNGMVSDIGGEIGQFENRIARYAHGDFGQTGKGDAKRRDPHMAHRFWVDLGDIHVASFMECSALTIETEVFEYAEGGLNGYTHKLPTRTKYGNITLKRGLDETQDLHSWYLDTVSGNIKKQNISIILYDPLGKEVQRWSLQNAFPVKWSGPDHKVDSGALAVETIEFAHEGLLPKADKKESRSYLKGLNGALDRIESNIGNLWNKADEMISGKAQAISDYADQKSGDLAKMGTDQADNLSKGAAAEMDKASDAIGGFGKAAANSLDGLGK